MARVIKTTTEDHQEIAVTAEAINRSYGLARWK